METIKMTNIMKVQDGENVLTGKIIGLEFDAENDFDMTLVFSSKYGVIRLQPNTCEVFDLIDEVIASLNEYSNKVYTGRVPSMVSWVWGEPVTLSTIQDIKAALDPFFTLVDWSVKFSPFYQNLIVTIDIEPSKILSAYLDTFT